MIPQPDNCAFLFPGQGSQYVGMGLSLAETYPLAREIFYQADEILHLPLSQIAWEGPEEELNDTVTTQPALLVHSVAALGLFHDLYPTFQPSFVAGHSMGELSTLVASGALSFTETLQLVRTRGELMKEAGEYSPGGMAAILGLDIQSLEKICISATNNDESVQVANDNCPGQVVLSGSRAALARAMKLARDAGARKVVQLAVSIAAHSNLMDHTQERFNLAVEGAPIIDPRIPIIGNVSARPLTTTEQIRGDLQAQLHSRVRWTESIQYLLAKGISTFLEIGTGSILTSLLRRIDRHAVGIPLGTPHDFEKLAQY